MVLQKSFILITEFFGVPLNFAPKQVPHLPHSSPSPGSRHPSKCFQYINSLNPHKNAKKDGETEAQRYALT